MSAKVEYKRAVLWDSEEGQKVRCKLCAWRCLIADGKVGRCMVRKNIGGVLYSLNYDRVCAANTDPIEKKPLFHFQPGSMSFSIACIGCNFRCDFCQNWQISQAMLEGREDYGEAISAERIVKAALRDGCKGIAYTYTEPTIFMELCADCAVMAKEKGLTNVFVSNGYMTREAIDFAAEWLDGINVDLKAFSEEYYKGLCHAKLGPVLDMIKYIARETDIWMEVTTLVLPGQNDSDDELKKLAEFLATEAGVDVPWHISRFYPQYKYTDSRPTPIETLERAAEIGKEAGLRYIYIGNVPGGGGENTCCYKCGQLLIERIGYRIAANNLDGDKCPKCGAKIAGRW